MCELDRATIAVLYSRTLRQTTLCCRRSGGRRLAATLRQLGRPCGGDLRRHVCPRVAALPGGLGGSVHRPLDAAVSGGVRAAAATRSPGQHTAADISPCAMETCDVLIAGGGPAGSTCAWALRQTGLDVVVMDKSDFPHNKVCAGRVAQSAVSPRARTGARSCPEGEGSRIVQLNEQKFGRTLKHALGLGQNSRYLGPSGKSLGLTISKATATACP